MKQGQQWVPIWVWLLVSRNSHAIFPLWESIECDHCCRRVVCMSTVHSHPDRCLKSDVILRSGPCQILEVCGILGFGGFVEKEVQLSIFPTSVSSRLILHHPSQLRHGKTLAKFSYLPGTLVATWKQVKTSMHCVLANCRDYFTGRLRYTKNHRKPNGGVTAI